MRKSPRPLVPAVEAASRYRLSPLGEVRAPSNSPESVADTFVFNEKLRKMGIKKTLH